MSEKGNSERIDWSEVTHDIREAVAKIVGELPDNDCKITAAIKFCVEAAVCVGSDAPHMLGIFESAKFWLREAAHVAAEEEVKEEEER